MLLQLIYIIQLFRNIYILSLFENGCLIYVSARGDLGQYDCAGQYEKTSQTVIDLFTYIYYIDLCNITSSFLFVLGFCSCIWCPFRSLALVTTLSYTWSLVLSSAALVMLICASMLELTRFDLDNTLSRFNQLVLLLVLGILSKVFFDEEPVTALSTPSILREQEVAAQLNEEQCTIRQQLYEAVEQ